MAGLHNNPTPTLTQFYASILTPDMNNLIKIDFFRQGIKIEGLK